MQSLKYPIIGEDNLALIYSGLGSISDKERKRLKNIAQSLIAIQNRPGTPVPDNICREIMMNSTNDLLNTN
jgi:hypothetical protein